MEDSPADAQGNAGRSSYAPLAFTSLGHFMNDGFMFIFPIIGDILASLRGYPPAYLTTVFVSFYASSTLFGLYAGRMADKGSVLGRIHTGIFLISVGAAGFAYVLINSDAPYFVALASSVLMGMGTGFYHPIGAAILQKIYSRRNIGKVLGINGSMGSVGRAVFPVLFVALAYIMSHGDALVVLAVLGIASSALIAVGLKPERKNGIEKKNRGEGIGTVVNYSIIVLTVVFFIRSVSAQGMVAWIPTYLTYSKGAGIGTTLGIVVTIMYSSAIIGQPLFGILVDRMDKRFLLFLSSLGTALAMYAYMNTGGPVELLFLSLFGFFTFSGFPLTMSLVSDYAPRGPSSLINSIVWGFGNSGGMILGPLLAGAIVLNNYSRIPLSFNVMIVLSVIVAFLSLALPKTGKKAGMPMFG